MTDGTTGTCAAVTTYTPVNLLVKANSSASKTDWIRSSTAVANWWTAQNWCAAKGYTATETADLGCSTSGYCTDDGAAGLGKADSALWALQVGGWTSNYYWLEQSNDTKGRTVRTSTSYSQISTSTKTTTSRYALCQKTYSGSLAMNTTNCVVYNESGYCTGCAKGYKIKNSGTSTASCTACSVANCASYNSTCGCVACADGYTKDGSVCKPNTGSVCTQNNCYNSTDACVVPSDKPISNIKCKASTGELTGSGTCQALSSFGTGSTSYQYTVSGVTYYWSEGNMNWWAAQKWCEWKGLSMVTAADLGCGSIPTTGGSCNGTVWSALINKWGTGIKRFWLANGGDTNCESYFCTTTNKFVGTDERNSVYRALCK